MSEHKEKEIVSKLKKQCCKQEKCLSFHEDNQEVIVFGLNGIKRSGIMCSQCLLEQQFINSLQPIQKHVLPIKKFMRLLTQSYEQYASKKQCENWGPTIVRNQRDDLKKEIDALQSDGIKSILEIAKFVEDRTRFSINQLKALHEDANLAKVVDLLNEQNQSEQQKMQLSNELSKISGKIKYIEGMHKYTAENQIKKEAEIIVLKFKRAMLIANKTLRDLIEAHKQLLKQLAL